MFHVQRWLKVLSASYCLFLNYVYPAVGLTLVFGEALAFVEVKPQHSPGLIHMSLLHWVASACGRSEVLALLCLKYRKQMWGIAQHSKAFSDPCTSLPLLWCICRELNTRVNLRRGPWFQPPLSVTSLASLSVGNSVNSQSIRQCSCYSYNIIQKAVSPKKVTLLDILRKLW